MGPTGSELAFLEKSRFFESDKLIPILIRKNKKSGFQKLE